MKFFVILLLSTSLIGTTHSTNNDQSETPNGYLYSGFDKQGHFFRGNKKTGFYYNYGTGETCLGNNQQRRCYMAKN